MNRKRFFSYIVRSSFYQRVMVALIGAAINILLAYIMYRSGLPFFFDTVGTIAVAALGGYFPGILAAVITNAACALFNPNAIYYGFLNALAAIMTAGYVKKHSIKNVGRLIICISALAVFSGLTSTYINWYLLNGAAEAYSSDTVVLFASFLGIPRFWSYLIYNILVNIIDKGVAVIITTLLLIIVPEKLRLGISIGNWKQRPLSQEKIDDLNDWGNGMRHTMRYRSTLTIVMTSLLLVVVTGWSGMSLYFSKEKERKTIDAYNMLNLVSEVMDAKDIRDYTIHGDKAPDYYKAKELLQTILDNYNDVENLSFVSFGKNRGRFIFDLSATRSDQQKERSYFEYDERLLEYLPQFLEGNTVEPLEHGSATGWMRSITYPIRDAKGSCICYAVAEISLTYMADYMRNFIIRFLLIFAGFFLLVLVNNLWFTNTYIVYPIRSMARCVDEFANKGYEQEQLDKNVKSIRDLGICTEDEVEKLYDSICRMTLNISEQMRDLRRLSEATAKMQDGLIITMADMVEKRDSDTGEHIQKTALYVKIIVEGLKKKGYYAEKVTPKFMSDVVRSAPLHDIGKINIPDEVLNKPGKLTDEEFEIMKTHTVAGKKIMENAISTVEGENYLKEARNMAAYHHERWDGRGYPEGLHGEVIPLSARIMAVADVFDALTSPRVYKPAFPIEKAISIITEESGKQFDPKCVEVFMDALPEVKVIVKKYNKGK